MLRVTGRVQRDSGVTHVVAERIEDISAMLDSLPALGVDKLCHGKGGDAARVPRYGETG
jgi:hypothetical protein